jgi:hypothetical protein
MYPRGKTYQGGGRNEKINVGVNDPLIFSQAGCEFIGGAAVGAGATGAGYEYNAYRQMQQLMRTRSSKDD